MLKIYREFGVEILIETACVKEEDFQRVQELVGAEKLETENADEAQQKRWEENTYGEQVGGFCV
eukprot:762789-Hanusia_phi.AAC.2